MLSQRRGRSRSRSTNNTTADIDQGRLSSLKANNYALLPLQNATQEDPASFNIEQLCWIRDNEPRRFHRFDFIHLSNDTIHKIVLKKKDSEPIVNYPQQTRRHILSMREFNRLSKSAKKRKYEEEDHILVQHLHAGPITTTAPVIVGPRCFCHTRNTIIDNLRNEEDAETIQVGFDSLVLVALRSKADFISNHLKNGKNANTKMLDEVLNKEGFLRERMNDMKSKPLCFLQTNTIRADNDDTIGSAIMNRYSFYAPGCDGNVEEGQIMCRPCIDIQNKLRRKCKERGRQDSDVS